MNPASPSLQNVRERLTRTQLLELMETGRGQMPSFAGFSAMEKRAVAANKNWVNQRREVQNLAAEE